MTRASSPRSPLGHRSQRTNMSNSSSILHACRSLPAALCGLLLLACGGGDGGVAKNTKTTGQSIIAMRNGNDTTPVMNQVPSRNPGNTTAPTTCVLPGTDCSQLDCCPGLVCVGSSGGRPSCQPMCSFDDDCNSGCCAQTQQGSLVCAAQQYCSSGGSQDSDECGQCAADYCTDEYDACDQACLAVARCVSNCNGNQTCVKSCTQPSIPGVAQLAALLRCIDAVCSSECQ